MALKPLPQPMRLIRAFVTPDCKRIEPGVYDKWPEGLPLPKTAVEFVSNRTEPDLPEALSETSIPAPVEVEKTEDSSEAQTMLALGSAPAVSAAAKAKKG